MHSMIVMAGILFLSSYSNHEANNARRNDADSGKMGR